MDIQTMDIQVIGIMGIIVSIVVAFRKELIGMAVGSVKKLTEWRKRRHGNKLTKKHFYEFRIITKGFEDFFDSGKNPLVSFLEEIDEKDSHLSRVQTPLKGSIDRSFGDFKHEIEMFDGTKKDFEHLVSKFENVLFTYEDLFIKPLAERNNEISKVDKLNRRYKKFAIKYNHNIMRYMDYGKKVNELFDRKVIRTDFDIVVIV